MANQNSDGRVLFTKEMKRDYTILLPNMLPIHFEFIRDVFNSYGYKSELLQNEGQAVVDAGLKYVHNDTCYPALLVIGQMIDALNSGKYDVNKTALMITQTGGGCRASNYIHLLRKALIKAGYGQIPVISLNLSGLEKNSGFSLSLPMLRKLIAAVAYGDMLMLLDDQVAPYEKNKGESSALVTKWTEKLCESFSQGKEYTAADIRKNFVHIANSFAEIKTTPVRDKIKVGIVGEIYVKYAPLANNHLKDFLMAQGCEVMVPGLMGFLIFKIDNRIEDVKLYGGSSAKKAVVQILKDYFVKIEETMIDAIKRHPKFTPPSPYEHTKSLVEGIIGYGNRMGEGWLLTAEMMTLAEEGYGNIVCAQPFGCLPNHIVGKGMIRKLRSVRPDANIVPIDYDPGATRVNQENRIKLMLAVARENMNNESTPEKSPAYEKVPAAHISQEDYDYDTLAANTSSN